MLKFLVKDKLKLAKVKKNSIFIVLPCIMTFLYYEAHGMGSLDEEKSSLLCSLFVAYQIINRTIRTIIKVQRQNKKKSNSDL